MNCFETARVVALVVSMFTLQGCFFHESGTWEDDPKNWKRMFGDEKPDGVNLVHSRFWRSGHFTYEATFYAQINPTPAFKEKLLRRTGAPKTTAARQYYANDKPPAWYVPKSMDHYECYSTGDVFTPLQIFVDKDDGTLFIFFSQL